MRHVAGLRTFEHAIDSALLGPVAGVDEAGRGACAGPISIAACILPDRPLPELARLTDSKKLTPAAREQLMPVIEQLAVSYSVILIDNDEIDRRGIQWANVCGMRRAVAALDTPAGYVLTDAVPVPGLPVPHIPMIRGDGHARCIAAASVLAKVTRDRVMVQLDGQYPGYGFAGHKGYGTKAHMDAVRRHGKSPVHRYTYANVAAAHRDWCAAQSPAVDRTRTAP
ncbi:ribonuclease HII [Corynebacterium mendelii]|uniref:ribonuclease HII n=1 Tax=Corynebacterium mendelii TaxID=2765362 RepID=UPI001F5CDCD4|nr:ribonuclease HII [Corynebacterium mendelii]